MTIPAGKNWCPCCEEACHDATSRICTVCGTTLQEPPARQRTTSPPIMVPVVPEHIVQDVRDGVRAWREAVSLPRDNVVAMISQQRQQQLAQQQQQQELMAIMMDPSATSAPRRPISKNALQNLTRKTLTSTSSMLFRSTVTFQQSNNSKSMTFEACKADFGPPVANDDAMTISGTLSGQGWKPSSANNTIIYMERGGGKTFCQKARLAQESNALACIIGNTTSSVWPYVMTDSSSSDISISVMMISREDARQLQRLNTIITCSIEVTPARPTCAVCREALRPNQVVVTLPCKHTFHESCVVQWLSEFYATCPYCRHALPSEEQHTDYNTNRMNTTTATMQDWYG